MPRSASQVASANAAAAAAAAAAMAAHASSSEDEDGDICRVCRCGADADRPLFYPCKCSGSIKYIHEDCLKRWLTHSGTKVCELCKHEFAFTPIYKADAPVSLPLTDMLIGLIRRVRHEALVGVRGLFVIFCWLFVVPLTTHWVFAALMGRASLLDIAKVSGVGELLTDLATGGMLMLGVVVTFLLLNTIMEIVHVFQDRHQPAAPAAAAGPAPQPQAVAPGAVEADPVAVPGEQAVGAGNRDIDDGDDDDDDDDDVAVDVGVDDQQVARRLHEAGEHDADEGAAAAAEQEQLGNAVNNAGAGAENNNAPGNAADADAINAGADAAPLVALGLFGVGFGHAHDHAHHAPHDPDQDMFGLEEMIGLRGPLFPMLENVVSVLLFVTVYMLVFAAVPFFSGSLVVATYNVSADLLDAPDSRLDFPRSPLNDALVIVIGYAALTFGVMSWMSLTAMVSRRFRLTLSPLASGVLQALTYLYCFLKVCILMFVELGVFPLACGLALDLVTTPMFGSDFNANMQRRRTNPVMFLFLHWIVGLVFMINFSSFVALLREVLRPGVLWFLRNPTDPDFHPIRDLIEVSFPRHVVRLTLSSVLYAALVVLFVVVPVQLVAVFAPSLYPVVLNFSDNIGIPIDLVLLHLAIPLTLERSATRVWFKQCVRVWFHACAERLDLTDYLLNRDLPAGAAPRKPLRFAVRILAFCFVSWLVAALITPFLFAVPILLGRGFLLQLPVQSGEMRDVYAFTIGTYMIWGTVRIAVLVYRNTLRHRIVELVHALPSWCLAVYKMFVLLVFWCVIFPICIGLWWAHLVFFPARLTLDQTPAYLMIWGEVLLAGFFLCKVWVQLCLMTQHPVGLYFNQQYAVLREHGVAALPLWHPLGQIAANHLVPCITAFTAPLAIVEYWLPRMHVSWEVEIRVRRVWPFFVVGIVVLRLLVAWIQGWYRSMQAVIRDDLYLQGKRLLNFGASAAAAAVAVDASDPDDDAAEGSIAAIGPADSATYGMMPRRQLAAAGAGGVDEDDDDDDITIDAYAGDDDDDDDEDANDNDEEQDDDDDDDDDIDAYDDDGFGNDASIVNDNVFSNPADAHAARDDADDDSSGAHALADKGSVPLRDHPPRALADCADADVVSPLRRSLRLRQRRVGSPDDSFS